MCGAGRIGTAGAQVRQVAGCGGGAVRQAAAVQAPATAGATSASTATAGARLIGSTAATSGQAVSQGTHKNSSWIQVGGRPSESAKARAVYENVSELVAKYPTADALRAAGFVPNAGSNGTHWRIPGEEIYADGNVFVGGLVTRNGITTGAQMDSKARWIDSQVPSGWNGVQWHYHHDNTAPWMFHIDVTKPLDQAFTQEAGLGGHAH